MLVITANIEELSFNYKDWFKKYTNLINEKFDTDTNFINSLSIGQILYFDNNNPKLPTGLSIPSNSKIKLSDLKSAALEVLKIVQIENIKVVSVGIRSSKSSDYIDNLI